MAVAGKLDRPRTDAVINLAIRTALSDKGNIVSIDGIDETDKVTIKVQLRALGLVIAKVSRTTDGGSAEFIQLTPEGQRQFIQGRVVKKRS